jgi:hypothetical protein
MNARKWHCRAGRARGRVRSRRGESGRRDLAAAGSAAGPALTAGADLPAGLPGRDRGLRVHRCRERPVHAVGQWIKRASQADLARLRAPWDPVTGRYRAPDEKTVWVVLDRLDARTLAGALLGSRRGSGGPPGLPVRPPGQVAPPARSRWIS